MSKGKTIAIWAVVTVAILGAGAAIALLHRRQPVTLRGAVLRQDPDPNRQLPLSDVQITAINTLGSATSKSDASGLFTLKLPIGLRRRQQVILTLRREGYQPLNVNDFIGDKIYVERMIPVHQNTMAESRTGSAISNTRIRYSVKATTDADVGSAVKTFQIVNKGNTPCNNQPPCAPGGKWKGTIGSLSLDAGEGNEFRNARVSCIAGPCPFTKIEVENFSQDRRKFNVSVLNWSDTVTFLLEAEVVHPMTSDMVRETYPVIFGRALNFSLPASAEGPSIEAEVQGDPIVFPLGPDLFLRWADCHMVVDRDQSKNYRCELKPGYQFR
ncbi:MAG TPA: hypothetical protein VFF50_04535 [Candidatus Deferrimicrobiaceae bacterium]|jgi:hypothetical protein|nr:hypothetical protein [Candidatus Deferrimicrobiaceae bacterium]